jgi:hypothetical protein
MFEYFADPFIFEESENNVVLFVERYSRIRRIGSIIRLELIFKEDQIVRIIRKKLIQEKYHLSFPCIYKLDNRLFIVPETASTNSLFLYEISDDGTEVLNKKKIAIGLFVDPIFFKKSGELFLMWYDGITNNDGKSVYCPIDRFPINSDLDIKDVQEFSMYRNAGRVIYTNYKPSQAIKGSYGKGLFLENMNSFEAIGNYWNDIKYIEFMKFEYLFENSHHVDILGSTIVFDISYEVNIFRKNKNVLYNIQDIMNETLLYYI